MENRLTHKRTGVIITVLEKFKKKNKQTHEGWKKVEGGRVILSNAFADIFYFEPVRTIKKLHQFRCGKCFSARGGLNDVCIKQIITPLIIQIIVCH